MNENIKSDNINKIENNHFELDKQLHEQYATNVNANTSSFISFLVALLVLFGVWGYAFVFVTDACHGTAEATKIPICDFYFLTIAVSGVIAFLSMIVAHLGYSQRSDQIVIDRIRNFYYKENKAIIFKDSYSPYSKSYISFIPGYYNIFWLLFIAAYMFIVVLTIDTGVIYKYYYPWVGIWQFIFLAICIGYRACLFYKYKMNDAIPKLVYIQKCLSKCCCPFYIGRKKKKNESCKSQETYINNTGYYDIAFMPIP